MFAGAFPLHALPIYMNFGIPWGSTIVACFSALLIPVPFLFFTWGARIRGKGQWGAGCLRIENCNGGLNR